MRIEVEKIDRVKAKRYLAHNIGFDYEAEIRTNRPVTLGRVIKYAKEMLAGRWVLTHHGIGFDKHGNLIDGQKRLMALIMAAEEGAGDYPADPNIVFETVVTRGLGDNVFDVIDTGETRTSSQVLSMNGIHNGMVLAAASRMIYLYDNVTNIEQWRHTRLTNRQILDLVIDLDLPSHFSAGVVGSKIGLIKSVGIAGSFICSTVLPEEKNDKSVDRFLHSIALGTDNGIGLASDDPRYAFREYLINSLSRGRNHRGRDTITQLMLLLKIWNDYINNRRRELAIWRASEGVILAQGITK